MANAGQYVWTPGATPPHGSSLPDTGIPGLSDSTSYIIVPGVNNPSRTDLLAFSQWWAADSANTFGAVVSDNQTVGSATVAAYPQNSLSWGDPGKALSSLPHLYATWNEQMPQTSTVEAEAEFDMYFATVGNPANTFELMVWVEAHNTPHATTSTASLTAIAQNVPVNGYNWDVWHWDNGNSAYGGWAFDLSDITQRHGLLSAASDFDLVPFISWMFSSGQVSYANPTIQFCDFGWEVWSTSGVPAAFTCRQFSLSYTRTGQVPPGTQAGYSTGHTVTETAGAAAAVS